MQPSPSTNKPVFDQWVMFCWMMAFATIWRLSSLSEETYLLLNNHGLGTSLAYAMLLLALQVAFFPRNYSPFLLLCGLQFLHALAKLPIIANHHFMTMFVCLMVLVGWAGAVRRGRSFNYSPEQAFTLFAPAGRMALVIMYFFGTLHKINTDFLNPEVSCAVAIYSLIPLPFGLADALWAHYAAIYGTLILEALAILFLFSQRLKYAGMLIGLFFHYIIGLSAGGTLAHFSSLAFALHVLFLPPMAFSRWQHSACGGWLMARPLVWRAGLAAFLATLIYFTVLDNEPVERFLWGIYGLGILGFVAAFGKSAAGTVRPKNYYLPSSPALTLLCAVFFLNGFSPYIGLKTESSIAMFSNLHVEGGETNLLLLKKPPYLFDYINRENIVTILETDNPYLLERNVRPGLDAIWFEMQRALSDGLPYHVRYIKNGQEFNVPDTRKDPAFASPPPLLLDKWLYFKPVDWKRPKACSH